METLTPALLIPNERAAPIHYAGYSSTGPTRAHNEDSFALPPCEEMSAQGDILLTLADGAGGLAGGGDASQFVADYFPLLYYARPNESSQRRLLDAVEMCNWLLRREQMQPGKSAEMLTTLVAVAICGEKALVAFVGDSKAYLIKASGGIQLLTEEHTQYHESVKAGWQDADYEDSAGIITRAIGLDDRVLVDIHRCTWEVGDRIMLCSDGVDAVQKSYIEAACLQHPPKQAANIIVNRAHQVDGSDNATVVIAAWG